jgi:rare lipoprotein A
MTFSRLPAAPRTAVLALVLAAWMSCGLARPRAANAGEERGLASYYAHYHEGRRTASGERFDTQAMTAAHRTLPFGTQVRVTNLANGQAVVVRINDRGPYVRGRMLDVSYGAAKRLGLLRSGVTSVSMEVI